MRAEIDGFSGGPASGLVTFLDGAANLGTAQLSSIGAGQTTLSLGYLHSCAVASDGGVKCWGYNQDGRLGDGTLSERLAPVTVAGLPRNVVAVGAGGAHTCALTRAGAVKCWGPFNGHGQLGDGTLTAHLDPRDVSGLSAGAIMIGIGYHTSCAMTRPGAVKCWGSNWRGQLGDGTAIDRPTPVTVAGLSRGAIAIATGERHACALTRQGGVKCWGANDSGQIGDGTTTDRPSPVDVPGLSGIVAISAAGGSTCALTRTGGAKCWGTHPGDGTLNWFRTTPTQVVGLSSGVAAIAAGIGHSCALTVAGGVRCWGGNIEGQLGDGTTNYRPASVTVRGLSRGAVAIGAGYYFTCAIGGVGGAKCWGANYWGHLGDGTKTNRFTPVDTLNFSGSIRARAAFSTPPLSAGVHWLSVFYHGDATHTPSFSVLRQRVD